MIEIQPIITHSVKKPAKIIRDEQQSKHKHKQEKQQEQTHDNDKPVKHIDEMV